MAYATHSTEAEIQRFLQDERASLVFLSTLAGLRGIRGTSVSRLSGMLRGQALDHDTSVRLGKLISKLKALRDRMKLIPIRFEDAQRINDLLVAVDSDEIFVLVVSKDDEQQHE